MSSQKMLSDLKKEKIKKIKKIKQKEEENNKGL